MSVLIKGMEMPSGCNMCQLRDLCIGARFECKHNEYHRSGGQAIDWSD